MRVGMFTKPDTALEDLARGLEVLCGTLQSASAAHAGLGPNAEALADVQGILDLVNGRLNEEIDARRGPGYSS